MSEIISHILDIDKAICKNIEKFDVEERGLLSQNILSQLRNFVEHISLKVLEEAQRIELNNDYENIKEAIEYIKARGDLKFLSRLHKLLQITASHYTLNEENSERLLLKYYEYLIKIKSFLKNTYNLEVLYNLEDFPIHTDSNLKEYYEKISVLIKQPKENRIKSNYKDRYYIQKIKPFFVKNEIYYEVTFRRANDYTSKFDRIIAFTKLDILSNYAVKLFISMDYIEILDKKMPIQIIDNWEVSIRPCEIDNFAKIFGTNSKISSGKESYELMKYLTSSGLNLIEIINLNDWYYKYVKRIVTEKARVSHIFKLLDKCREMSKTRSDGYNVLRYLLLRLNNKIIKKQYKNSMCELLSNLNLEFGCIPFDQMPFNSALINHNPKLSDLFLSINTEDRKHEILARHIKNNTEQKGQLYTSIKEIENFENVEKLIEQWNENLYRKHKNRQIEIYKTYAFIKGYEADTFSIIEKLKDISSDGIKNYKNSIKSWLQSSTYSIDCEEKKSALKNLFEHSKVALIYGAAGTGKSTMINHISNFFDKESKLYLANTNPAVDNLKRNIKVTNCTFKTITKFSWSYETEYDILIIDECSTVSNSDMLKILTKAKFRLLILVGDVFQIESILFGNWFSLIKYFIPESSVFELEKPYRSNNHNLLRLWERVRNIEDNILETLTKNQYSTTLDNSIFENTEEDEIILCLNYDGLYGINNINSFLQSSNNNEAFVWGTHTYKINDPIIFNESGRFSPLIYNNLKGKISRIELLENQIQFDIEVYLVLNEFDTECYDFELLDNAESGNSVIRFTVDKYKSTDDDDDDSSNIIPFQVAYAVSIHKAQGLEYNSVKIVITDEVEEMISHNIFYTAITRAKEKLRIYWTPESEKNILGSFKTKFNRKDYSLLKAKYNL
ncbi:ATP-dependent DNA helicase [Sinomicrobium weinanense]|uniref:AAA family ATPase n=1 Tax=Sinomicrobium weinanense TaxID=2842200 RepID=A0A926Q3R5_9FLAO|nr:ATP-dependent RecD-like DNA helicase [Sinomicrobium weinanense]MBC9797857.1 AAA family ATPase [Sinomicrobium weinanense]MBU3122243.1 ATP-dependent RecD-like DNA helicase [Sinomicrobium weinanense]